MKAVLACAALVVLLIWALGGATALPAPPAGTPADSEAVPIGGAGNGVSSASVGAGGVVRNPVRHAVSQSAALPVRVAAQCSVTGRRLRSQLTTASGASFQVPPGGLLVEAEVFDGECLCAAPGYKEVLVDSQFLEKQELLVVLEPSESFKVQVVDVAGRALGGAQTFLVSSGGERKHLIADDNGFVSVPRLSRVWVYALANELSTSLSSCWRDSRVDRLVAYRSARVEVGGLAGRSADLRATHRSTGCQFQRSVHGGNPVRLPSGLYSARLVEESRWLETDQPRDEVDPDRFLVSLVRGQVSKVQVLGRDSLLWVSCLDSESRQPLSASEVHVVASAVLAGGPRVLWKRWFPVVSGEACMSRKLFPSGLGWQIAVTCPGSLPEDLSQSDFVDGRATYVARQLTRSMQIVGVDVRSPSRVSICVEGVRSVVGRGSVGAADDSIDVAPVDGRLEVSVNGVFIHGLAVESSAPRVDLSKWLGAIHLEVDVGRLVPDLLCVAESGVVQSPVVVGRHIAWLNLPAGTYQLRSGSTGLPVEFGRSRSLDVVGGMETRVCLPPVVGGGATTTSVYVESVGVPRERLLVAPAFADEHGVLHAQYKTLGGRPDSRGIVSWRLEGRPDAVCIGITSESGGFVTLRCVRGVRRHIAVQCRNLKIEGDDWERLFYRRIPGEPFEVHMGQSWSASQRRGVDTPIVVPSGVRRFQASRVGASDPVTVPIGAGDVVVVPGPR